MANKVWLFPTNAERDYTHQLVAYSRNIATETQRRIADNDLLRLDGWSEDVTAVFVELLSWALAPGQTSTIRLPDIFASINIFNDKQWRLVVKAGTGMEIPPSGQLPPGAVPYGNVTAPNVLRARFGLGVDVYRSEPWLVPLRDNWIAENTRLIKSIPEQYLGDVEGIVRRGVSQGLASKEISKQIKERTGVSDRRAQLIATDQVGKANGALTEHRQTDLGVKEYEWQDSDDSRVRPTHKDADGKTYSWDKPPSFTGGHPGFAVRCRCWAKPKFPKQ